MEIIAIDESGITGLRGHSVYAFVFIPLKEYVGISQRIVEIERRFGLDYIHRHEMSWSLRNKIAAELKYINVKIHAVIYQNPVHPSKSLEGALVLKISKINHAYKVFIDGYQNKKFIEKIKKTLKKEGLKKYRIKFVNDISEPVVRLTDFIAGSIRSYIDNPTHTTSKDIYEAFKSKIEKIDEIK